MNPHRKGNAFPQAGVPGDPRLLDQMHRQQVRGPNMQITHIHSGTLITPKIKSPSTLKLQFQVSVRGTSLVAAAGVFDIENFVEIVETLPADGIWYLEAKAIIDELTGAIDDVDVYFTQSFGTSASPDFYSILADITVTDGIPDITTLVQYNYGPMFAAVLGGAVDKWTVFIY